MMYSVLAKPTSGVRPIGKRRATTASGTETAKPRATAMKVSAMCCSR